VRPGRREGVERLDAYLARTCSESAVPGQQRRRYLHVSFGHDDSVLSVGFGVLTTLSAITIISAGQR
jgi:hypothetical protein